MTIGEPKIIIKSIKDEEYTFSADVEHLGIQENDYTLSWSVDDEDNFSANQVTEFTYDFSTIIKDKETQDQHIVKLKVTHLDPSIDPIIVEQPILLQKISSPEMIISPIKGKSIVVSANVNNNLPNDTIYLWSVEGQPSIKGSGLSTTLNFPQYATAYTVTLTAKLLSNGEILTTTKTITTGYGLPSIKTEIDGASGNDYILSVDKTGTGLPDNTTYLWAIGNNYTFTGDTTTFEFVANTTTTVNLTVTVGNEIIGIVNKQVTSGNKSDPVILSVTKGYSPLDYTVKATFDEYIDSDGSLAITWYIDDKEVSNQNTSQLKQTFPYTDKTYMVRVKVIKTFGNTGDVITYESANTPIKIGSVYDPKVTITPQKYPKQFDISVDLKNTGIKDNWSLKWEFPESFTINNTERLKANVTSKDWDVSKQFKLIATPPSGTSQNPVEYNGILKVPEMPYVTKVSYEFHPLNDQSPNGINDWVKMFNQQIPNGVESITAENDYIVWTCKKGYGTTKEVRDLSFLESMALPTSLSGNKTSKYYSVYERGYKLYHYSTMTVYNGGTHPVDHDYGLNCFKLD